jgi:hypothetical protein
MKVFNPKIKRNQDLFEIENLCPVFAVCCRTPDVVIGDKGAAVYLNVEACNEEEAIEKALLNKEFTTHLRMERFDKDKHLDVYTPSGLYVIGRVDYFEGDPRL